MIKPRTIDNKQNDPDRPTFRIPRPESDFGGWGPRLRY
jgi:hypothetical protein